MIKKCYRNILIVKLSSLGDVIHALPSAAALRELYPEAKISWITEPAFAGFLPGKPILDEILLFDKKTLRKKSFSGKMSYLNQLKKELHAKQFDLVIDLQGLAKSALVAWLTGTKDRIGYCEMREMSWLVSKGISGSHAKEHVIERYLDVIRYLGADIQKVQFPLPDLMTENVVIGNKLLEAGYKQDKKLAILAPGTSWETKCWPVAHYAVLADQLIEAGFEVALVGGREDQKLGEVITGLSHHRLLNFIGNTSLRELAALLKQASLYVSGDTGPLHIAVATGTPLVALFGPTNPERTGPYGNHCIVLRAEETCAPCFKKKCDHPVCMKHILPEHVYEKALEIVGRCSNFA